MSTYDELLAGAKHQAELYRKETENFHGLAKDYIPQMCEALEKEKNHTKEDIRDRVMKDCLDIWGRTTIEKYIPVEYKDPINRANRLGKKKQIEESDTQANDSLPNNEVEEKYKEPLHITTSGQIESDYHGKSYGELTEEQKQKAYEDSKLDTRGEAAKQIDKFQQLQKQLEEKDLKINELRSGIQQALVNKRIESTTQQEQIDNLKKQLEEQKQMSNNDITIITLDFKKFSEFIKSCEPAGEYTKLLLHVNTKTGKMIKMDAE